MASMKRTKALSPSDDSDVSEGSTSSNSARNKRRQLLQHWLQLYLWLEVEGTGEDLTVFGRDCKKAKLSNEFSKGKKRPSSGWKKEYLQRHADSNQHSRHAQKMGFRQASSDPCLYINSEGELFVIAVYVYDMVLATKSKNKLEEVKRTLCALFEVKDLGELHYILGVTVNIEH